MEYLAKFLLLIIKDNGDFNVIHVCQHTSDIESCTQHRFFGEDTWMDTHLSEIRVESVPLEFDMLLKNIREAHRVVPA